ncbi:hypothetical protein [Streptomyces lydicus]|uniref:Uncharacterized protein n=1 Tax=Streptomyces lydicus TaxID=47763 RepID=A0A1D7VJ02_9ACTN|nr:hypothetical protein [Streptomyces lydicus]AOP46488.1 hypothetical protein SL103_09780 [Streptomyces lydicus]
MTTTDQYHPTRRTAPSTVDESAQSATAHEVSASASRPTTPIVQGLALLDKDPRYDRRTGHAALLVDVCFLDGTKTTAKLELDPGRVQLLSMQLERAIALREAAGKEESE